MNSTGNAGTKPTRARITVQRRVEWSDTDAAGHQDFTSVLRWAEQAEILLHERLGIAALVEPGAGTMAWPAHARRALLEGGAVDGEHYVSVPPGTASVPR